MLYSFPPPPQETLLKNGGLFNHNLLTLPHLHRVKQSSTSIPLSKTYYLAQLQLKREQNINVKNLHKAQVLADTPALWFVADL